MEKISNASTLSDKLPLNSGETIALDSRLAPQIQTQLIQNEFTILSYNLLADSYADPKFFPSCKDVYLNFTYRSDLVIQQLRQFSSDIICLQEVDHFEDVFRIKLQELGYNMVYAQKNRRKARWMLNRIQK